MFDCRRITSKQFIVYECGEPFLHQYYVTSIKRQSKRIILQRKKSLVLFFFFVIYFPIFSLSVPKRAINIILDDLNVLDRQHFDRSWLPHEHLNPNRKNQLYFTIPFEISIVHLPSAPPANAPAGPLATKPEADSKRKILFHISQDIQQSAISGYDHLLVRPSPTTPAAPAPQPRTACP